MYANTMNPDQTAPTGQSDLGQYCLLYRLPKNISRRQSRRHFVMSGEKRVKFLYKFNPLTLCILETPKRVLLQTVKTQMKCPIKLHFIRVYTVCDGKKDLQIKKYNIFW